MDRGVDAVNDWTVMLIGGRFDGESRQMFGSADLEEPPQEVRAYDCPCCGRCAVPLPGGSAQAALDDVQAEWVPYVLADVSGWARVAMYRPPDPLAVETPDLLAAIA